MKLSPIVQHLDSFLKRSSIQDYPQAHNGLQLENDGTVERIVVAVDACATVLSQAAAHKNSLLIVHHGLFWGGLSPLTGPFYQKIKLAMDQNLAIYSSHLPLDLHPEHGNNILLAKALDLAELRPALKIQGELTGYVGQCSPILRAAFLEKVSKAVGGPVHLAPGGPDKIEKVLVVTGGAGNKVIDAVAIGVDTFVTGEGSHSSYIEAEELGINLIYAGHYATETFGVKSLGEYLSEKFDLLYSFIDHPTRL